MTEAVPPVLQPATEAELAELVRWAAAEALPLELFSGGSKPGFGRPVQSAHRLDLGKLAGIRDYQPAELVLTAGAATPMAEIDAALAAEHQMLAFEPGDWAPLYGRPAGSGTLGGALACNLAGPRRIKAGAARDHFLGFRAVSGRGEAFKAGGKVVKNVTGYDLSKLMAGSWGTLAVLTEVTIKVLPAGRTELTLLFFGLDDSRACELMAKAMNAPVELSGAAHLPTRTAARKPLKGEMAVTALRLEGFEASVAARTEALIAALKSFGRAEQLDAEHSREFWTQVREVEAFRGDKRPLWRISVAPASGWRVGEALSGDALYDWAGGLIWLLSQDDPAKVRGVVHALGGHTACYRGEGSGFEPVVGSLAALSARVKAAFDPNGVLNPGRMAKS
jgi:glycolate oxidase FAD binding subunit